MDEIDWVWMVLPALVGLGWLLRVERRLRLLGMRIDRLWERFASYHGMSARLQQITDKIEEIEARRRRNRLRR